MTNYVRCINNKAYLHHKGEPPVDDVTDLTIGHVYKVLPPTANEQELGHVRVIDDTGEDYLFPASYFAPIVLDDEALATTDATITVHVSPLIKAILRAEALAAHKPMSALIRTWMDEHLDLPVEA